MTHKYVVRVVSGTGEINDPKTLDLAFVNYVPAIKPEIGEHIVLPYVGVFGPRLTVLLTEIVHDGNMILLYGKVVNFHDPRMHNEYKVIDLKKP